MCLILIAWQVKPGTPCVIAANRDEFHDRPTAPAQWWKNQPSILAGRDRKAQGTWLGVTRSGRFAALTNFRGGTMRGAEAPSRGELVTNILESNATVAQGLAELQEVSGRYNDFNLIFSDGGRLGVFESTSRTGRELGPGIYGLSNHLLDTPWPKVQLGKGRLQTAIEATADTAPLLELLRDDSRPADDSLPRTGVSLEWERLVSSAFIRSPTYGTRCSTIIRIEAQGRAYFDEWSCDSSGAESGRRSFQFDRG